MLTIPIGSVCYSAGSSSPSVRLYTSGSSVSADMGGVAGDAAGCSGFMPFIMLAGVAFRVHSIVLAVDSFPGVW